MRQSTMSPVPVAEATEPIRTKGWAMLPKWVFVIAIQLMVVAYRY